MLASAKDSLNGSEEWDASLEAFSENRFEDSLAFLETLTPQTSRLLYNKALVLMKLGEYDRVQRCLAEAVQKDVYLTIAYLSHAYFLLTFHSKEKVIEQVYLLEAVLLYKQALLVNLNRW